VKLPLTLPPNAVPIVDQLAFVGPPTTAGPWLATLKPHEKLVIPCRCSRLFVAQGTSTECARVRVRALFGKPGTATDTASVLGPCAVEVVVASVLACISLLPVPDNGVVGHGSLNHRCLGLEGPVRLRTESCDGARARVSPSSLW